MRRIALLLALAACPAHHKPIDVTPRPPQPPQALAEAYSWKRVETAADLPKEPPAPGTYRVHLIDVGTGLSILIQGADFAKTVLPRPDRRRSRSRRLRLVADHDQC